MGRPIKYHELGSRRWLLREYQDRGRSMVKIAAQVGCTRQAVAAALRRHKIPVRPASQFGRGLHS